MTPVLEIEPLWLSGDLPAVSDTWRWFYLERWLESSTLAAAQLTSRPVFHIAAPSGYASLLRTAAWLVAEAVFRDGTARKHLDIDQMRWARRTGIALLGHERAALLDGPGGAADSDDHVARSQLVLRVVPYFPEQEHALLYLSLPPATDGRAAEAERVAIPSFPARAKLDLIVRLAKAHLGAVAGVETPAVRALQRAEYGRADEPGLVSGAHIGHRPLASQKLEAAYE